MIKSKRRRKKVKQLPQVLGVIKKMVLGESDTLVLSVPKALTIDQRQHISTLLRAEFKRNNCIILEPGFDLSVIAQSDYLKALAQNYSAKPSAMEFEHGVREEVHAAH